MMDDALAEAVIDISGRGRLIFEDKDGKELKYSSEVIVPEEGEEKGFLSEEVREFFWALAGSMKANISVCLFRRGNTHHEVEATFKAFAKALRTAVETDPKEGEIPSTKGVID